MYENIEIINVGKENILISRINGEHTFLSTDLCADADALKIYLNELHFFDEVEPNSIFNKDMFKTVFISLHISSKCNMACSYCFKKERNNTNLDFEQSKKFIDMITDEYSNAGKYIVDPTGSGEPLLNKNLLYQIGEYCKEKSNELKREVLPMIATNGTLLNSQMVDELRKAGILFGVSLDGNRKNNDFYRKDIIGNGVYGRVIGNIRKIKDRSLMGVAVTLTDKNVDLVQTIKHLIKYFPTISIKPVRSIDGSVGITQDNVEQIMNEYTKLLNFLVKETNKGNLHYVAALLNGDDYFGKFILRTVLNQKVITGCDAGIGRYSLAPDKKIYACPAAVDIQALVVGDLKGGIDDSKRKELWQVLTDRSKCNNCFARFVCGGECLVSSYYKYKRIDMVDENMCRLKKHLYKLSLLFKHIIKSSQHYKIIYNACLEKTQRFDEDLAVSRFLEENTHIKFTDVKMNKEKYFC